jgi:hypothetical protein
MRVLEYDDLNPQSSTLNSRAVLVLVFDDLSHRSSTLNSRAVFGPRAEMRGRLQRLETFKPVWQGSRYSLSNGGGWLGEGNGRDDDEGVYGYDVDDEEMYVGGGGDDYDGEEEDGRGLAGGDDLDEEDEEYLLETYPNTLKALE